MTNKPNRLWMYAKGTAIGVLALVACSKNSEDIISGPIKAKTEKAVNNLKNQDSKATAMNEEIQKAKTTQTRAPMQTMDERIAEQEVIISAKTANYLAEYDNITKGADAIVGFDKAAQAYANTTPLNMEIFRHRVTIHHELAIQIEANNVPEIPHTSLNNAQKMNLSKFKQAAFELEFALEIMERLTGGVERMEQQINDLVTWIYELSEQIIDILETASGTSLTRAAPVNGASAKQNIQNAERVMSKMTEDDLRPYSKEIDHIIQEIEHVQNGLDAVLKFWEDLRDTTIAQAKPVSVTRGLTSTNQQRLLARNFYQKKTAIGLAQYNRQNTRVRA